MKKISIVGLGYVGLPLALHAEKKGYVVTGIVKSKSSEKKFSKKLMPFHDEKMGRDLKKSNIRVTTDFNELKKSEIIILCVPTPINSKNFPDFGPLKDVCKKLSAVLCSGQLIILESTINPGVSKEIVLPFLQKSGLKPGIDFFYAHCPERINPGDSMWNVENIPRVIGGYDKISLEKAVDFYSSILSGSITKMNTLEEAEAVKIVENAFRDINIAFVNELALSFAHLGIDVTHVINAAATKPFSFMPHYPGCGVGGHCIPVDPYYLIHYAQKKGFRHDFLLLARKINNYMPYYTVELTIAALKEKNINPKSARVAVLGLAYKANIDDMRESPAIDIIHALTSKGIRVKQYDPYVLQQSTVQNLSEALSDVDAIIIATDHTEFKNIHPHDLRKKNIGILIDGRNCLNKEIFIKEGVLYKGIGR